VTGPMTSEWCRMYIFDRIAEFETLLDEHRRIIARDPVDQNAAQACERAARVLWEGCSAEDQQEMRTYFWDALVVDWEWLDAEGPFGDLYGRGRKQ
jgi:hypothetical protein